VRLSRPVRAFWRVPSGKASIVACLLLVVVAIVAPMVLKDAANTLHFGQTYQSPSWQHPFGTDSLGRDILARVLVATRLSFVLAVLATLLGCAFGAAIGAISAMQRSSSVRAICLRAIDTLQSFPILLVAIFVVAIIGSGEKAVLVGTALGIAFQFARVTSTLALSVQGREFMAAARVIGVPRRRLVVRYALANAADVLLITFAVAMSRTVITISALSFLGLGIQPPRYDWGNLLTEGVRIFYEQPVAALGPAAAIAFAALAFGFLGEALARASNPRLWVANRRPRGRRLSARRRPASGAEPIPLRRPGTERVAPALLEVDDLRISVLHDGSPVEVIHGAGFSVAAGEIVGIAGESGSGKTLTSLGIGRLLPTSATIRGTVMLDGRDVTRLGRRELNAFLGTRLSYVFQDPTASLSPSVRIGTQLTEGMVTHLDLDAATARSRAEEALTRVGIASPARVMRLYPHELSGGMRQRVMIASALSTEPKLLVADEPTTSLDVVVQAQVMDLITEFNERSGAAVLLISHNLALLAERCSRIMIMYAGRIVEDGPAQQIIRDPQHPYTRALLEAVPDLYRSRDERLSEIPGEIPEVDNRPGGCAFHPRCPLAMDVCRAEDPTLERLDDDGRRIACWAVGDATTEREAVQGQAGS
jgi:oligopeptide/dipeptide ABC transporter ATP-binding protein